MPSSLKPFKTFEEQVEILKSRNLVIADEGYAQDVLSRLNYYRFSGYAFLRLCKDSEVECFQPDTSFESILALYEFDQIFRSILFRSIETIEVLARTKIAYYFSMAHPNETNDSHYDPRFFCDLRKHEELITKLNDQIEKNKDVPFVKKHIASYNGRMPLWVAVEILSFSSVSILYSIMLSDDKRTISKSLGQTPTYFENWLHVLSVLRNKCAHYGRLYACEFSPPILFGDAFKRKYPAVKNNTVFAAICVMCKLLPQNELIESLVSDLDSLLIHYDTNIHLNELCFPKNWKTILLAEKRQQ